jgi:hypothetical protein
MEKFFHRKLNQTDVNGQFRVEIIHVYMLAALEDLDADVNNNSAWTTIRENIKFSAKESLA